MIYRDSCFICHAENKEATDELLLGGYPSQNCIQSRYDPLTWIKSMFIRPEDIELYNSIGCDYFKITGRTASTPHVLSVAEAYMEKKLEGNLLALWKDISQYQPNLNMSEHHDVNINNSELNNFVNFWFSNLEHECEYEVCGETCSYSNNYYKSHIK